MLLQTIIPSAKRRIFFDSFCQSVVPYREFAVAMVAAHLRVFIVKVSDAKAKGKKFITRKIFVCLTFRCAHLHPLGINLLTRRISSGPAESVSVERKNT